MKFVSISPHWINLTTAETGIRERGRALIEDPFMLRTIYTDLRQKALWCYESDHWPAVLKVLFTDGTLAMILYRFMQWSRRWHLKPLEMVFNKINAVASNCIIGRGAEFGPGFVLIHATGIVINGRVRGGSGVYLEHQVTIGAERRQSPVIGNNVFIGAGAKILGPVIIGDGARIGANAVVVDDVPAYSTVVGIPARVVRTRPGDSPLRDRQAIDDESWESKSLLPPVESSIR